MKLFCYYAFHSIINSLKKLFKTWIAVFFVICFAVGIIGGLVASSLDKLNEAQNPDTEVVSVEADLPEADSPDPDGPGFLELYGITSAQMIEAIVSLVFLVVVFFNIVNTDGASKIFKPADIPLLFASPLKPQSVMLFRLVCNLGMLLVASLYLLFQIPNFVVNLGMSVWGAFSLLIAWALMLICGMLFQVTLYTVSSRHPVLKKNMSKIVYAFFGLIVVGFIVYSNMNGGDYITCAITYLTSPATRFVPFWGWLRGFCVAAIAENTVSCIIYAALFIAGLIGLIALIWSLDADFYEDALESAEHAAELLEKAKNGTATNRKKDRSEKLRRDGLNHGFGANVFFYKSMYNRFRFATLHVFTKTFFVYLAIALIGSYFCQRITDFSGFIIVACIMAVVAFYRTLGNPLQEDTSKAFFVMVPETAGLKLLWSLLAGSVNCLLDVTVPMIIAAIWLKPGIFVAIMWILFIVSMDFFGTTVGAFIGVSVPTNAGQTVKQLVQILFIYFGLAPAAILVIVGIILGQPVLFMLIAVFVNLTVGAIFFALTPRFLENGNK